VLVLGLKEGEEVGIPIMANSALIAIR